ncbi:twin-arginine translocation signal domain-containing protein [bacterium]|nr:twin-arginine translocation signal domain-containing protein [bacterium]
MKKKISRRGFLSGSAAVGLGAAAITGSSKAHAVETSFAKDFTPQDRCFMRQYCDGILKIADGIRTTQIDNISKAMEKAYELQKKGGKIYSHVLVGHFAMFAGSPELPGQPNVLPQRVDRKTDEDFAAMKEGDFLITNGVSQETLDAKNRGVYVVGLTNNYIKFYKTPPDALRPEIMKMSIEDVSSLVIDSQMPWENGLIAAPQLPQFRIIPSSGISQFLVYWACTAALATLIGSKGKDSGADAAKQYLDLAYDRFRMIGTDLPKVDRVAGKWADLVLGEKARLLVYGHPQKVEPYLGTKNMFVNEACIVASGAMIADQYETKANELKPGDIVLIGAITSDNADEINVARQARKAGAYVVSFGPFATDGDSSGIRLFKEVDAAFNTYCDESEGVIAVKNFGKKVSPLTGVAGNFVHWLLMAQWTDHMVRRGEMPYFWQGYHERDGQEYDKLANPYYLKRGY